jgi:hypothetical protein
MVWYEQDADTLEWYISYTQLDNEQSPWRLRTQNSPFVKRENVEIFCEGPEGAPSLSCPRDVISYVRTLEAAGPFIKPVAATEVAYHARIRTPIDLTTMRRRAKAGLYEEPGAEPAAGADASSGAAAPPRRGGMAALWDDMKRESHSPRVASHARKPRLTVSALLRLRSFPVQCSCAMPSYSTNR